ncbi:hypothetical protein KEM56_006473 [Ascosphaera pollenicola]|nr:hypothetical protein KEM56_006473 [Ascosphaera pollenicola]
MSEEQELLARIGQLAGQINQHKNSSTNASSRGAHAAGQYSNYSSPHPPARGRGWAPYRARGSRGRYSSPMLRTAAPHRNRTLVLNNSAAKSQSDSPAGTAAPDQEGDGPAPQTGWVAKRDRHMQLINSALYQKEAEARTKAIDETRKQKARQRDEREKARVLHLARAVAKPTRPAPAVPGSSVAPQTYSIVLHDIPFQVANGGSKLIRLSKDTRVTFKKVMVGGVPFVRSSCYKGPSCRYTHDPNRVAICKDFLLTGQCPNDPACDLSHDPIPERTPACVHFLRGRCNNDQCRYAHVRVSPGAPVCRDFAVLGYCGKGAACMERHVHECPDYANKGSCPRKRCALPHVDRAGQIRKMTSNRAESSENAEGEEEDDDISSDEEYEQLDSDDVSSDGESEDEPVLILPGEDTGEVAAQQDFIGF